MIIDCRTWSDLPDQGRSQQGRVFVDGQEIKCVWYVDTEAGFVKTHDLGDGRVHNARLVQDSRWPGFPTFFEASISYVKYWGTRFCMSDRDDVLSRTIRGKVEVRPLAD